MFSVLPPDPFPTLPRGLRLSSMDWTGEAPCPPASRGCEQTQAVADRGRGERPGAHPRPLCVGSGVAVLLPSTAGHRLLVTLSTALLSLELPSPLGT